MTHVTCPSAPTIRWMRGVAGWYVAGIVDVADDGGTSVSPAVPDPSAPVTPSIAGAAP